MVGRTHVAGTELTVASPFNEPALLDERTLTYRSEGVMRGGGLRLDFLPDSEEVRFGTGLAFFEVTDLTLDYEPLPSRVQLEVSSAHAFTDEIFLGAEVTKGPIYLYVDARLTLGALFTNVELHDSALGLMGTTQYSRWTVGFGPRLGALIPIGHSLMGDVGVHHTLIGGIETWHAYVGIGYWENDRRDEFTEELKRSPRGDF